jgi:hypothetical protein
MNHRNSIKQTGQANQLYPIHKRLTGSFQVETALEQTVRKIAISPVDRQAREERIRQLEARLRESPGDFSWLAHDELRDLYQRINERKSMEHADTILAQSVMDEHILNGLSGWHDERSAEPHNPGLAVAALLDKAGRYPDLVHLGMACLLKAGDIIAQQNRLSDAQRLYHWALNLSQGHTSRSLEPYLMLAYSRLDTFRL